MRILFFCALLVVSLALVGSAPAAVAQSASNNSTTPTTNSTEIGAGTPTPTASPQPTPSESRATGASSSSTNETTERIDSQTVIVSSSVQNGSAIITLRSSASQSITLSDAGGFAEGGVVETRTIAVKGGSETTVEMPVTEQNGMVGVGISTEQTALYSEIIERGGGGGLGVLEALSSMQSWIAGIVVAFIWMIVAAWTEMRGSDTPEVA